MPEPRSHRLGATAAALWALSALFLLRVLGQAAVVFLGVQWLPPMSEWQSGLLPYPLLLASQIVILGVMAWINTGVLRGDGYFARPHPRLGRCLLIFAIVYAGAMLARYLISATLHPERRLWPPGSLPIMFHFVLATYLYLLSRLARTPGAETRAATSM